MSAWILALSVTCLSFASSGNLSRPKEVWPISKAFSKADIVMIAKVAAIRDAKEGEAIPPQGEERYLSGVVTSFKVEQMIKGEEKRKSIELIHFKNTPEGIRIINGPCLVSFKVFKPQVINETIIITSEKEEPVYMLFLTKRSDGRYEPVSGQYDADDSVKLVQRYR